MRDCFNEINITPLTDIFLVLLIIMMVIAPMLDQQGLNLAVPEIVNEHQINKNAKIMKFEITDNNVYIYEGQTINTIQLENLLKENLKNFPDGLLIQVDENSEHAAVVKLMDIARNVGFTAISLTR